jgi:thiosulfate dehydrogenase [quinone] large subunit
MSNNPVIDYHVIYAIALIVVALTHAGDRVGLGEAWARVPFVARHRSTM